MAALEGRPPINELSVHDGREEMLRTVQPAAEHPVPMAEVREVAVQGAAGPLPARLFVPFEQAGDSASPLLADGRLYVFSEEGKCTTLAAGREFKKLGESIMSSGIMATPAIAGKAIYLRTKTDLYRIEE